MTPAGYAHQEAFCLMTYRSDDGTEEEIVWNSRDGVTPFVITLLSGKEASHADWRSDRRMVDYRPPVGSRIFVDLTPERARQLAERNVDRFLSDPDLRDQVLAQFGGRDAAIHDLATDYLSKPGAPDLIVVAG